MNYVLDLLLWLHLVALALAGVSSFGIPITSRAIAAADPAARPALIALRTRFSKVGLMALGTLVISGPLLLLAGDDKSLGLWFGMKIAAVFVLAGVIFYGRENAGKAAQGDADAIARAPMVARLATGLLMLVILLAVLAFR